MKAIMVMYDSLNRHMLPPYGGELIHAPNFKRLAEKTVTFDNSYVASMPCMPARRELHTGRYNFLHRSWGPMEPFDDSMPEILSEKGIYTHLISDHQHYWEDGGCTYHTRYSSWEISRGQEGDKWKGELKEIDIPEGLVAQKKILYKNDVINRKYMQEEDNHPQAKTFNGGLAFIEENHQEDNWFLQIETFDPHEPFFSPKKYKELYPYDENDYAFDWPNYKKKDETEEETQHCQYEYAALVSMCDHYLGKVLDMMDAHNMWEDTMLIVNTDHGFLLGEHDWWGKTIMPWYNEIAHTPLFIWDPRSKKKGERRKALVQTIDLPATLLDFFEIDLPRDMQGKPLRETIERDKPVRDAALFGIFGGHVNCTDGRYVYMRGVREDNKPLYQYTLMPTHMRRMFSMEELHTAQFVDGFEFTKGCKVIRTEAGAWGNKEGYCMSGYCQPEDLHQSLLFDLDKDPKQENPIQSPEIEKQMIDKMLRLMEENEAPKEQYIRLELSNK